MSDTPNPSSEQYEIRFRGHIPSERLEWFEGGEITHEPDGETILRVEIVDQSALHGLLNKIRDLNIALLSVTLVQSDEDADSD